MYKSVNNNNHNGGYAYAQNPAFPQADVFEISVFVRNAQIYTKCAKYGFDYPNFDQGRRLRGGQGGSSPSKS